MFNGYVKLLEGTVSNFLPSRNPWGMGNLSGMQLCFSFFFFFRMELQVNHLANPRQCRNHSRNHLSLAGIYEICIYDIINTLIYDITYYSWYISWWISHGPSASTKPYINQFFRDGSSQLWVTTNLWCSYPSYPHMIWIILVIPGILYLCRYDSDVRIYICINVYIFLYVYTYIHDGTYIHDCVSYTYFWCIYIYM